MRVAVVETDAVVATLSRARAALTEAKTIQETKRIVDAAAAAEIYARRQKLGDEASDLALSIKVEALRKLGEMLAASPKATGVRMAGSSVGGAKVEPPTDTPTLADLGLTKKESAVAQKLAALPEEDFQQVRDGHVTVAKAIAAVDATRPTPTLQPIKPTAAPQPQPEPKLGLQPTDAQPEAEVTAEMRRDAIEQMAKDLDSALKDNAAMGAVFDASPDEQLKVAMAQILELRKTVDARDAEIATLRSRLYGIMGEKNVAVDKVKTLQRVVKKLEGGAAA